MKKFIDSFKLLWSNRRYRSIIILGLYVLFFVFVFLVLSSSKKEPIVLKGLDLFEKAQTYSYIDKNNNIPLEQLKVYEKEFTPAYIYQLIDKATLASTDYINKSNTYILNDFLFQDNTYDLKITTYEVDNKIIKVELSFEQYILQMEVEY